VQLSILRVVESKDCIVHEQYDDYGSTSSTTVTFLDLVLAGLMLHEPPAQYGHDPIWSQSSLKAQE